MWDTHLAYELVSLLYLSGHIVSTWYIHHQPRHRHPPDESRTHGEGMESVLFWPETRIPDFFRCFDGSQNFGHVYFHCFSIVMKMEGKSQPGIPCYFHSVQLSTISMFIPPFKIHQDQLKVWKINCKPNYFIDASQKSSQEHWMLILF